MTTLDPRHYQWDAIKFLLDHRHGMIYDQPGLGKTLEATEAANVRRAEVNGRVLVVCPAYLVLQWRDFLLTQYPNTTVQAVVGTRWDRIQKLVARKDWTIVNKEMVRSYNLLLAVDPCVFILDEAHHFRGNSGRDPKNLTAQALLRIAKGVPDIYLLTGTPIYRETDDLFSLLRLLDWRRFSSYWKFVDEYCKVVGTPWGNKVVGTKDRSKVLDLLREYGLGRTYTDVGVELPSLVTKDIIVDLEADARLRYDRVRKEYTEPETGEPLDSATAVLRRLRLITSVSEAKKQALLGVLLDIPPKEPVLIFTWYRESAREIGSLFLPYPDLPGYCVITGEMDPQMRYAVAKDSHWVVATMSSLSEGIDLSHIHHVIFWEEPYEPGLYDQALARVRRFRPVGDPTPVIAYHVQVARTADTAIHRVRLRRESNINAIMQEVLQEA